MKKAVICLCNAFYMHNHDEWDSFRAEGRIITNIGFGLSLLGYDVNIIFDHWNFTNESKKTWNNIQLSRNPIYNHYDISLSFSIEGVFNILSNLEIDKCINMVYNENDILRTEKFVKDTGINLKYVYPNKHNLNNFEKHIKDDLYYLPPLYPIPSINEGFLPCSYNPELPELKVYLHYTSWPQNTTISGNRFTNKEQLVINYLKDEGYKIKLSILVENRGVACPITNDDTIIYYSNECDYHKIIDLIRSADICMTNGAPVFPGNSLTDIVSLGKPLIYIGDGRLGIEWKQEFTNYLYTYPDNFVYIQEYDNESIEKISKIMSNPLDLCKKYADIYKDFDFNTWKTVVKEVFE